MSHHLLEKYPTQIVPIIQFGADHPDILPLRRSRSCIANLEAQDEIIKRIFRKRFGRWYVHIPSLIEYMETEESIISAA